MTDVVGGSGCGGNVCGGGSVAVGCVYYGGDGGCGSSGVDVGNDSGRGGSGGAPEIGTSASLWTPSCAAETPCCMKAAR